MFIRTIFIDNISHQTVVQILKSNIVVFELLFSYIYCSTMVISNSLDTKEPKVIIMQVQLFG